MTSEENKAEDNKYRELFSEKLKTLLKYRKISVQQIAGHLNKSVGTVFHWKSQKSMPTIMDVHMLAQTTELDVLYFFEKERDIESADLLNHPRVKEDYFTQVKKSLFTSGNSFSDTRQNLAREITDLPEKDLRFLHRLIQAAVE